MGRAQPWRVDAASCTKPRAPGCDGRCRIVCRQSSCWGSPCLLPPRLPYLAVIDSPRSHVQRAPILRAEPQQRCSMIGGRAGGIGAAQCRRRSLHVRRRLARERGIGFRVRPRGRPSRGRCCGALEGAISCIIARAVGAAPLLDVHARSLHVRSGPQPIAGDLTPSSRLEALPWRAPRGPRGSCPSASQCQRPCGTLFVPGRRAPQPPADLRRGTGSGAHVAHPDTGGILKA